MIIAAARQMARRMPSPVRNGLRSLYIAASHARSYVTQARERAAEEKRQAAAEEARIAVRRDMALKNLVYWYPSLDKTFTERNFERIFPSVAEWTRARTESSNFYYELDERNELHLAHLVATAAGSSAERVRALFAELQQDTALRDHLTREVTKGGVETEVKIAYGRRLGWYAFVRLLKPRVVIETGVDHGVGSCVICSALLRNAAEGTPGRYFGTEIRPEAGESFQAPYTSTGTILYGDSIETLRGFADEIDLFINDSNHSAEYEAQEYEVVRSKLSAHAVILGDNSQYTDSLAHFSAQYGRRFIFFREAPKDHWYPGAGIGVSLPPTS